MPSWMPEGDVILPQDNETRTLAKWCSLLYDSNGPGGQSPFPEGNRPLPGDDDERLEKKINALFST